MVPWRRTKCSKTRLEINSDPLLFQLSDGEAVERSSLLHQGRVLSGHTLWGSTCRSDAVLIQLSQVPQKPKIIHTKKKNTCVLLGRLQKSSLAERKQEEWLKPAGMIDSSEAGDLPKQ